MVTFNPYMYVYYIYNQKQSHTKILERNRIFAIRDKFIKSVWKTK